MGRQLNPSQRIFDAIGAQLILCESFGAAAPTVGADYEITKILGAGGFGLICRATNVSLRREIALKLFPLGSGDDSGVREALREARSLARLEHPGIVAVYGAGESEVVTHERLPCAYVEMQLVEGLTLRDWLERLQHARDTLRVLLEAGRALAYAHEHAMLHRDFKPENLMVDGEGGARIIDFGLALSADPDADPELANWDAHADAVGARATSTGLVRGTPGYMAPEASQGRPMAASDQFAFAVVVREALTGRHPFASSSAPPSATPSAGDELFEQLRAVLDRGMSPSPGDRFASVAELCDAIEAAASQASKRRRAWAVALTLGLAASAGILAVMQGSDPTSDERNERPEASVAPAEGEPTPEDLEPEAPAPSQTAQSGPPANTSGLTQAPAASPGRPASCAELDAWAGTWQLGSKIAWTEFAYQQTWRVEYELDISLGPRCAVTVNAHKYPPLIEGELPGEPVEATGGGVAVVDGDSWRLPLRLAFTDDGRTYTSDEFYEMVLHLDHAGLAGQADRPERIQGAFRKVNHKGYPIRTGMLLGQRGVAPDLSALASSDLPCAARCRLECAGETAERSCRTRACEALDPSGDICGAPSPDYELPLRAIVTRQTVLDGKDPFAASLERGRAAQLAACPANARALAGSWSVWASVPPYDRSERLELELEAEDGCQLSGRASSASTENQTMTVSGHVTGTGTWVLTPTLPTQWFPAALIFAGVAEDTPAFGADTSDPPHKLRARKLPAGATPSD